MVAINLPSFCNSAPSGWYCQPLGRASQGKLGSDNTQNAYLHAYVY